MFLTHFFVNLLKGVSTELVVMASPYAAAPIRVDSLGEDEANRMVQVVVECASEAYLAALVQANPQLLTEKQGI